MKLPLAAAGLVLGLCAPLAAQTVPPSGEAKPPVPEAGPSAPPAGQPAADPAVERQRNGAAKLAGMIRFVAAACPEAEPDYDRFKRVIAAMRVDIKELENGPLMATSLGYSQAYQKEPQESCKRAFEHFGENGTTIPGLLARKAPESAPGAPQAPGPVPSPDKAPDGKAPNNKAPDNKGPDNKGPDDKSP